MLPQRWYSFDQYIIIDSFSLYKHPGITQSQNSPDSIKYQIHSLVHLLGTRDVLGTKNTRLNNKLFLFSWKSDTQIITLQCFKDSKRREPWHCVMPNSAAGECVCSGQGRPPGGGGVWDGLRGWVGSSIGKGISGRGGSLIKGRVNGVCCLIVH